MWRSCGSPTPLHRGRWEVVEREVGTPLPLEVVAGALIPVGRNIFDEKDIGRQMLRGEIKHETRTL